MSGERAAVLVVEGSEETRGLVGGWLDEAGFDAIACPGPTGPDCST